MTFILNSTQFVIKINELKHLDVFIAKETITKTIQLLQLQIVQQKFALTKQNVYARHSNGNIAYLYNHIIIISHCF